MANSKPEFDADEQEFLAQLGAPASTHPRPDVLLACAEGVLPQEQQLSVQAHLDHCSLCTGLLADLATLPEAQASPAQLDRIAATLPLAPLRRPASQWKTYAAIAAAVILCISAGIVFHLRQNAAPPVAQVASPEPAKTVAALEIPLNPLSPPQSADLQTRGSNAGSEPSVAEMLPAFSAYNAHDYAAAAQRFTPLAASYPHSGIIPLYLGVTQLLLNQDDAAAKSLANARRNATSQLKPSAVWYSAIAAQRLHAPDARTLLESLCTGAPSDYTAPSCRIAPTLPQ